MSKLRIIFILLIVGVYYGYTKMQKTYKNIPAKNSARPVNDNKPASNIKELITERSLAQTREVFYRIVIDRFFDGNKDNNKDVDPYNPTGFHGGDFEGVEEKLEYISSLGVTAILLNNPMLQNKTPISYTDPAIQEQYSIYPYHGERPVSISKIDPLYGDMGDLEDLVSKAHDQGLKVFITLDVSQLDSNTDLTTNDQTANLFNPKAPRCNNKDIKTLWSCVNQGNIRFDHESDETLSYIVNSLKNLHTETKLDGVLFTNSAHFPEKFARSLFKEIVSDLELNKFNFAFDYSFMQQPYRRDLMRGRTVGYLQYDDLMRFFTSYVYSPDQYRKTFMEWYQGHSAMRLKKYLISDLSGRDTRSLSELYRKDENKMIKHLALWGFTTMNLSLNYGEEIGLEHGKYPTWNPSMRWSIPAEYSKYHAILKRMLMNRKKTNNFLRGYTNIVYEKDGLIILEKSHEKKVTGFLALNNSNKEQTIFFDLKNPLQNNKGFDSVSGAIVEPVDNGITFTVDANSAQFITF